MDTAIIASVARRKPCQLPAPGSATPLRPSWTVKYTIATATATATKRRSTAIAPSGQMVSAVVIAPASTTKSQR